MILWVGRFCSGVIFVVVLVRGRWVGWVKIVLLNVSRGCWLFMRFLRFF